MPVNNKNHSPVIKDTAVFAAWILGILFLGSILWYISQDFIENRMLRKVNAVLINNNDVRRLVSVLPNGSKSGTPFQKYQRFSVLHSSESAVVVTIYYNTVPAVFAVFINSNGEVHEFLPLDKHSVQVMGRIEQTKLDAYKIHVEEYERQFRNGE